jgi:hypothetical protein
MELSATMQAAQRGWHLVVTRASGVKALRNKSESENEQWLKHISSLHPGPLVVVVVAK